MFLSFLVVLVNGDNPWIRRWSGDRVKLPLPQEGARKRKKSEMQRKGREGLVSPGNLSLVLLLPVVRPRLLSIAAAAWFFYYLAMAMGTSP